MRNILLTLEYDGSRYQGWQRLGKGESTNTVSNKILEVLKKMTNEDVELFCGARTEVGVHAYGQVVNFKTTTDMTLLEIKHYMNRYLPMDIAVLSVEEKPERFHASLNAKPDLSIPCCYCRSPKRVRPQIYISFFQKTRHRTDETGSTSACRKT